MLIKPERTGATVKTRVVTQFMVETFNVPLFEYPSFFNEMMCDHEVYSLRPLYQFDTMTFEEAVKILSDKEFTNLYTDEDFLGFAKEYARDTIADYVAQLLPGCNVAQLNHVLLGYEFTGDETPETLAQHWIAVSGDVISFDDLMRD